MSKFDVSIVTNNAAFEDGPGWELARLLREVADKVEGGILNGGIRDYNGHLVGTFNHDTQADDEDDAPVPVNPNPGPGVRCVNCGAFIPVEIDPNNHVCEETPDAT